MTRTPTMASFLRSIVLALTCVAAAPGVCGADTTLFNLYLTDGTTLLTYGEYSRVGDRVIFSMLMGGAPGSPRIQAVTLPASLVDWARTDRVADSVRAQHYAQTRGEVDFAQLSNEVAAVLNDIVVSQDRQRALEKAQQVRATLVEWPRQRYGYRQRDVQEIVALLDEAISGLRASLGMAAFDLELVAGAPEFEPVPLPDVPSLYEQVTQVFRVAGLTGVAAERVALLRGALLMLDEAGDALPAADVAIWRRAAEQQIRTELAIDERYTVLARRLLAEANRAAANARVSDVQRVLNRIPVEDERLGGARPEIVRALRVSVEARLAAAQELRLRRDQWAIRRSLYRDYQRQVGSYLLRLVRAEPALEAIRQLDGPDPEELVELRSRLRDGVQRLAAISPPSDLRQTHELLMSAWRFAEGAVERRLAAAAAADLSEAWAASSSAAGALMLLARTQQEIQAFLEPPQLR